MYKTSKSFYDYFWLREQARAQHAQIKSKFYSHSYLVGKSNAVSKLLFYFCIFLYFSLFFVLFSLKIFKIFQFFLVFGEKRGCISKQQYESARSIKSKIHPPRLKINIVLNVFKVRVILTIILRPFIKYAKDTVSR